MFTIFVYEHILILGRANFVVIHFIVFILGGKPIAFFRFRVTAVEESVAVP
jgi:hypothetical protein